MRRHAKASFAGSTKGRGMRRSLFGFVCLCVLGFVAFLGGGAPAASAQACPNEALRQGPSANLPDCRAYELVSPIEKEGWEVTPLEAGPDAPPLLSADGNASAYAVIGSFGESQSGALATNFVARRSASGWNSEGITPPLEPYNFLLITQLHALDENLDKSVWVGGREPPLTPDASAGTTNLYLRELDGSFRLLSVGAAENLSETGQFSPQALSEDFGHVVFKANKELTGCGAPAKTPYLCEWSAATGELSMVGRAPVTNEILTTSPVAIAAPSYRHSISADGSVIFFSGGGEGCGVCVRINGTTTQIVTETGTFQIASSDGSVAYVTDGGELERYDVAADELTPLTTGGEVQNVLGASNDGSKVYLVAKAELAPGATAGEDNLYLWTEGGGFEFIATGITTAAPNTSRVTPDGMHLTFAADNSLTGYPNEGHTEFYLYSAGTGELVCASCNPSGEPAISDANLGKNSGIPQTATRLRRNLADNGGRFFFNTKEGLLPRDTNNQEDVYEYDAASGEVGLISPGVSYPTSGNEQIRFGDASPSGGDVVFQTRLPLVSVDDQESMDVYDARVDGGLASQNPSQAPSCTGEACLGETSTPSLASAASSTVVGKGNLSSKQNCNKLGKEAKKLSNRSKQLRKNANKAKKAGNSRRAKQLNKKANRLAKQARNKSKSAKKCRKRNRGASK